MALKRKIKKADFDVLTEERKELYKENPSRRGEYVLDMDDDDDNALKNAYETIKQEKVALQTQLDEANNKVAELEEASTKNKGKDVDALKASYEKKLSDLKASGEAALNKAHDQIKAVMADSAASAIATKISKLPKLLAKEIRSRLDVDLTGDKPVLTVLDEHGKPSAFSVADLEQEFVANKDYADIIIASKATGGDTGRSAPPQNVGDTNGKPKLLSEMSPAELHAHMATKIPKD